MDKLGRPSLSELTKRAKLALSELKEQNSKCP